MDKGTINGVDVAGCTAAALCYIPGNVAQARECALLVGPGEPAIADNIGN
jgi:hypothetical protein